MNGLNAIDGGFNLVDFNGMLNRLGIFYATFFMYVNNYIFVIKAFEDIVGNCVAGLFCMVITKLTLFW